MTTYIHVLSLFKVKPCKPSPGPLMSFRWITQSAELHRRSRLAYRDRPSIPLSPCWVPCSIPGATTSQESICECFEHACGICGDQLTLYVWRLRVCLGRGALVLEAYLLYGSTCTADLTSRTSRLQFHKPGANGAVWTEP